MSRTQGWLTGAVVASATAIAIGGPVNAGTAGDGALSRTGDVILVSATSNGKPANGRSQIFGLSAGPSPAGLSWSPDGTKIAFASTASNLVSGTGGNAQVFVKDLRTGRVTLISSTSHGKPGNRGSTGSSWSPDGTRILFESEATNLVSARSDCGWDLFVKNLLNGTTVPVGDATDNEAAWSPDGKQVAFVSEPCFAPQQKFGANLMLWNARTGRSTKLQGGLAEPYAGEFDVSWSPDGSRIAFVSNTQHFLPRRGKCTASGVDCTQQVFAKNLRTGELTVASSSAQAVPGDSDACEYNPPAWSPDGTRILFESAAGNLVSGGNAPSGQAMTVYLKDLTTGGIVRVSAFATGNVSYGGGSWSPDGRRVVFFSTPGFNGGSVHIYVRDLSTKSLRQIDAAPGQKANAVSAAPEWSPDGTRIAFASKASNLVPGDSNKSYDVFIKSLRYGTVFLASSTRNGRAGNGQSGPGLWSPDGSKVVFDSKASNLVPTATRHQDEIYVKVVGG